MLKLTLSVLVFAATLARPVSAQTYTGAIRLQLQDPSGARVHAEGAITGPIRRRFDSSARGIVELENLPPGHYRVKIHSEGFAPQTIAVEVTAQVVMRDVTLAVTDVRALVNVVTDTPVSEAGLTRDQIPVPVQTFPRRTSMTTMVSISPTP